MLMGLIGCPPTVGWSARQSVASESPAASEVDEIQRVAVAPIQDGTSDAASVQLAASVHAALERLGLTLVPQRAAQAIVQYQQPASDAPAVANGDVAAQVAEAKRAFLNFQNAAAARAVAAVEAQFRNNRTILATDGRLYADALLLRALMAHSGGNPAGARDALETLARVAPTYDVRGAEYPPSLQQLWAQARGTPATGTIDVVSDPPAADVLVNGVRVGTTPLKDFTLPTGQYAVAVVGTRYAPMVRDITVATGQSTPVRARLHWVRDGKTPAKSSTEDTDALVHIASAQRIGQLTHSQRVLVLDVDEAARDDGMVTLRLVDAPRGASFAPQVIRYNADRAALQQQLDKTVRKLGTWARLDVRKHPGKLVDPGSSGSGDLLAQRDAARRDRRMTPLLWGLVGLAAVGGIVGGILLTGGGGAAATGALLVHF